MLGALRGLDRHRLGVIRAAWAHPRTSVARHRTSADHPDAPPFALAAAQTFSLRVVSFSRSTESGAPRHLGALAGAGLLLSRFPGGSPSEKAARHAEERRVARTGRTSRRLKQGEGT